MRVIFLHGPPAVGKLTIARALSTRIGWPVFHNHLAVDAALALFPFGSEPFNKLRATYWLSAFAAAARERKSFIFTFCPEPSVTAELLQQLDVIVRQADGLILYCQLECAVTTLAARVANPDRQAFGKLTDPALFRRLAADGGFQGATLPPPALRLDTGVLTPKRAAERIAALVQSA